MQSQLTHCAYLLINQIFAWQVLHSEFANVSLVERYIRTLTPRPSQEQHRPTTFRLRTIPRASAWINWAASGRCNRPIRTWQPWPQKTWLGSLGSLVGQGGLPRTNSLLTYGAFIWCRRIKTNAMLLIQRGKNRQMWLHFAHWLVGPTRPPFTETSRAVKFITPEEVLCLVAGLLSWLTGYLTACPRGCS